MAKRTRKNTTKITAIDEITSRKRPRALTGIDNEINKEPEKGLFTSDSTDLFDIVFPNEKSRTDIETCRED